MTTERARVTREEAARLVGVTPRTINRWAAAGDIDVTRPKGPWHPAEYDREQVIARALRTTTTLALPEPPETDNSA